MDDLIGKQVVREGQIDAVKESVESAESDGVHALGFGSCVVFVNFGQENLNDDAGTLRLLSF